MFWNWKVSGDAAELRRRADQVGVAAAEDRRVDLEAIPQHGTRADLGGPGPLALQRGIGNHLEAELEGVDELLDGTRRAVPCPDRTPHRDGIREPERRADLGADHELGLCRRRIVVIRAEADFTLQVPAQPSLILDEDRGIDDLRRAR